MTQKEISIAPMLDWTDKHFRFFIRQITHHAMLYSEMIAERAIILGDTERLLGFNEIEKPIALQIGGSTCNMMAKCAELGEMYDYDEININAGCPSERVKAGAFGACLMEQPDVVANCIRAMKDQTNVPISVKTRIALEGSGDGYEELTRFVKTVAAAGCTKFIIHARKAKLTGSTPKENREKLPLNYDLVYRLKQDFPNLFIVINGNITTLDAAAKHLKSVDSVMIGRAAYGNPYMLAGVDKAFYGDPHTVPTREEIIQNLLLYIHRQGVRPLTVLRHTMGLYYGQPRSKEWKQTVMENDLTAVEKFIQSHT